VPASMFNTCEGTQSCAECYVTEMRILLMAAKQGPNTLLFMSSRIRHILFISVMAARGGFLASIAVLLLCP
jgi:hypothetical protein